MTGIYMITNMVNGKIYIGQSVDIERRFARHRYSGSRDCVHEKASHLYKAMRKYGVDNFKFDVLEECDPEMLNEREIYYIAKFNSANADHGYNETLGGGGYSKYDKRTIESLWNSGLTITEVAKALGCGRNTVKTALRALNVDYQGEALKRWVDKKSRGVTQYLPDGTKLREWKSAREAERQTNIDHSGIGDCCNYLIRLCGGFRWRYTVRTETAAMADLLD